ncbi:hypothetical protein [Marinobacter sp.]|uniref:hypothetical protein n=1 Tax=Marinobacter sp. TaxID=50741 RepID=UPI0034A309BD
MPSSDNTRHSLRKPLLILEFGSLAILLISMGYFSANAGSGDPVNPVWLLIPALASLAVFCSFIGLMYLRWVAAAHTGEKTRHKIIFSLLAATLIGVWLYGIVNTWASFTA